MANGVLQTKVVCRRFGFIFITSDYPLSHCSLQVMKLAYES